MPIAANTSSGDVGGSAPRRPGKLTPPPRKTDLAPHPACPSKRRPASGEWTRAPAVNARPWRGALSGVRRPVIVDLHQAVADHLSAVSALSPGCTSWRTN